VRRDGASSAAILLFLQDDPQRVHDTRKKAAQGEEDVQPEVEAEADLEEHAQRRQEEGKKDADDVQNYLSE